MHEVAVGEGIKSAEIESERPIKRNIVNKNRMPNTNEKEVIKPNDQCRPTVKIWTTSRLVRKSHVKPKLGGEKKNYKIYF